MKHLILGFFLVIGCKPQKIEKPQNKKVITKVSKCSKVVITVLHAEVKPGRPSGSTWDTLNKDSSSRDTSKFLAWGAAKLLGLPLTPIMLLSSIISSKSNKQTGNVKDPDIFVKFLYSEQYRFTPVSMNSTYPSWDYKMVFDIKNEKEYLKVSVIDIDGESSDPIGHKLIKLGDLCKRGVININNFGSVKYLTLFSEPYNNKYKSSNSFDVSASYSWSNSGIKVISGQKIKINAAGSVCASGSQCSNPNGFPLPRWRGYNMKSDSPHCGLLVKIGDGNPKFVGTNKTFIASGTGTLFFGPNDTDLGNNSGKYEVEVWVE
jgi:C2 domain